MELRIPGEILAAVGNVRVELVGDLGLDVYWRADMTRNAPGEDLFGLDGGIQA